MTNSEEPLDGPDYVDFEYWEETSMFDENPTTRWAYGIDCFEALKRCRVPADEDDPLSWIGDNFDYVKWLPPIAS